MGTDQDGTFSMSPETGNQSFMQVTLLNELSSRILVVVVIVAALVVLVMVVVVVVVVVVVLVAVVMVVVVVVVVIVVVVMVVAVVKLRELFVLHFSLKCKANFISSSPRPRKLQG